MSRLSFFIDGFNLYHALNDNPDLPHLRKYKWLDLRKLCESFTKRSDTIADIFFFTAYAEWNPDKVKRHKVLVRAVESRGVKTVLGRFRKKDRFCRNCRKTYVSVEEKQTDVNIAIRLLQEATKDTYDTAMVLSGDSDLIPAVEAVKSTFPGKTVGIIIPPARRAEALKQATHFHIKMKEKHLRSCQFPDELRLGEVTLKRPQEWR